MGPRMSSPLRNRPPRSDRGRCAGPPRAVPRDTVSPRHPLRGSSRGLTPLHSRGARDADRPEPRLHQLDRVDRPGDRGVWRGRPAPATVRARPAATSGSRPPARSRSGCSPGSATGPCPTRSGRRPSSSTRDSTRRAVRPCCCSWRWPRPALVVRRARPAAAPAIESLALGSAALALLTGALAWGGGSIGTLALLLELSLLSAATGGVFAAMILGHWYLVTPEAARGAAHPARTRPARGRRPSRSGCSSAGSPSVRAPRAGRRSAR